MIETDGFQVLDLPCRDYHFDCICTQLPFWSKLQAPFLPFLSFLTMTSARNTRMFNRNKVRVVDGIIKGCPNKAFHSKAKLCKSARVDYLNRIVGKGSVGFRHRLFMHQRIVNFINRRQKVAGVGKGNGMLIWSEITKDRPSGGQRDNSFECGFFFGDMPWFMELYAQYLLTVVEVGGVPRMPSDAEMRTHFRYFWARIRAYFGVRPSESPLPVWAH